MPGHKVRGFKQHVAISLEDLVPKDNFHRLVDQSIDLSFVRDLADEFYPGFVVHRLTQRCSSGSS